MNKKKVEKKIMIFLAGILFFNNTLFPMAATTQQPQAAPAAYSESIGSSLDRAAYSITKGVSSGFQRFFGASKQKLTNLVTKQISKMQNMLASIDKSIVGGPLEMQDKKQLWAATLLLLSLTNVLVGISFFTVQAKQRLQIEGKIKQLQELKEADKQSFVAEAQYHLSKFEENVYNFKQCLITGKCSANQKKLLYVSAITIAALVLLAIGITAGKAYQPKPLPSLSYDKQSKLILKYGNTSLIPKSEIEKSILEDNPNVSKVILAKLVRQAEKDLVESEKLINVGLSINTKTNDNKESAFEIIGKNILKIHSNAIRLNSNIDYTTFLLTEFRVKKLQENIDEITSKFKTNLSLTELQQYIREQYPIIAKNINNLPLQLFVINTKDALKDINGIINSIRPILFVLAKLAPKTFPADALLLGFGFLQNDINQLLKSLITLLSTKPVIMIDSSIVWASKYLLIGLPYQAIKSGSLNLKDQFESKLTNLENTKKAIDEVLLKITKEIQTMTQYLNTEKDKLLDILPSATEVEILDAKEDITKNIKNLVSNLLTDATLIIKEIAIAINELVLIIEMVNNILFSNILNPKISTELTNIQNTIVLLQKHILDIQKIISE